MCLKKKKFILFAIFTVLFLSLLSISAVSVVNASGTNPMTYQPGTSYTHSHSINVDEQKFNYAPEAHAMYWFNQNSKELPVQVYYAIYPHMEQNVQVTMNCKIDFDVKYKVLFWDKTESKSKNVTYDDLYGKSYVTDRIDGPNKDAIYAKTTYTFSDAEYGDCTWIITAN